jgi:hypothetical protein
MTLVHRIYRLKPGESLNIDSSKGDILSGTNLIPNGDGTFDIMAHVLEQEPDGMQLGRPKELPA